MFGRLPSPIALAQSLADSVPAGAFVVPGTGLENPFFLGVFDAWVVSVVAPAAPETVAFQDLMTRARMSGRYEIMIAVLVVAEWVYLDWADPHEDRAADLPFWLGEWITLHAGPGFAGVVAYLQGQLDKVWDGLDAAAQAEVTQTFQEAVRLERAFFDAAWSGFKGA